MNFAHAILDFAFYIGAWWLAFCAVLGVGVLLIEGVKFIGRRMPWHREST